MDKEKNLSSTLEALTAKVAELRRESTDFSKLMEHNRGKMLNLVKTQLQSRCKCRCNLLLEDGSREVVQDNGEKADHTVSKSPGIINQLMAADRKSREHHHLKSQDQNERGLGRDRGRSKLKDQLDEETGDKKSTEKNVDKLRQLLSCKIAELEHARSMVKAKSSELASMKLKLVEIVEENRNLSLKIERFEGVEQDGQNDSLPVQMAPLSKDFGEGADTCLKPKDKPEAAPAKEVQVGDVGSSRLQESCGRSETVLQKRSPSCWTHLDLEVQFGSMSDEEGTNECEKVSAIPNENHEHWSKTSDMHNNIEDVRKYKPRPDSPALYLNVGTAKSDAQTLHNMIMEFDGILWEDTKLMEKYIDSQSADKGIHTKWDALRPVLLQLAANSTVDNTIPEATVETRASFADVDGYNLPCAFEPRPKFSRSSFVPRLDLSGVLLAGVGTLVGQDDDNVQRPLLTWRSESSTDPIEIRRESSNPSIPDSLVCGSMGHLQRDNLMMHQSIKELAQENQKLVDDLEAANSNIYLLSKELYQKDEEKNTIEHRTLTQLHRLKHENNRLAARFQVAREDHAMDCQRIMDALFGTADELMSMQKSLRAVAPEDNEKLSAEYEVTRRVYKEIATVRDQIEDIVQMVQLTSARRGDSHKSRRMNDSSMSESHHFSIDKVLGSARECLQIDQSNCTDSVFSHNSSSCSTTQEGSEQEETGYLQFDLLHSGET